MPVVEIFDQVVRLREQPSVQDLQAAAVVEHPVKVLGRGVEEKRCLIAQRVRWGGGIAGGEGGDIALHRAVGLQNALGYAGGAGGIDEVERVLRTQAGGDGGKGGSVCQGLPFRLAADQGGDAVRQWAGRLRVQNQLQPGIGADMCELFQLPVRV